MGRLAGAFAGWRSSTSQLAHERRLAHTSVARLRLRVRITPALISPAGLACADARGRVQAHHDMTSTWTVTTLRLLAAPTQVCIIGMVPKKRSNFLTKTFCYMQSAAAAFSAWRVHVPYSRGKRDMLREALSAMTERGQRAAWRAWREVTGQRTRRRTLLQQALKRMQSSFSARVSVNRP